MINNKLAIAFDVDDTLLVPSVATDLAVDTPSYSVISIYKWFQDQGYYMVIWSGSGLDWARTWADKLGLKPDEIKIKEKCQDIDISFDDCEVDLAKVNIRVKRLNNQISRKDWNENKNDKNKK
jgi:hypothetical protein